MIVKEIIDHNPRVEGFRFREAHMYNLKCDEIFRKNEMPIKQLQDQFHNASKKYLSFSDCQKMLQKADIEISTNNCMKFFAESLMSRIDTLSDLSVMHKMIYVEFLCFISRVSHFAYEETKYHKLGLHLKIDLFLTKLFDPYQI